MEDSKEVTLTSSANKWLAIDEPQPDFDLWKLGVSVAVTIFIIWVISRLAF
ncbi:uncharacterized protein METZ01_LOCUS293566 [marine metagenome]|uniref:Uncharacterized protein n=1 Tax=marine metagenome TaxID=408172 RepID=A0A382M040_9ZZZZ